MAFTDHSDLFGSVHEDGINLVVRHLMRQRPSLFNYATPVFHDRPELFCNKIEAAPAVMAANNPLFTEQAPLPILGAPVPLGVNFCLQLTDAELDFHPGNVIRLPPELGDLREQHFALRLRACAGIDCPSDGLLEELLPALERLLLAQKVPDGDKANTRGDFTATYNPDVPNPVRPPRDVFTLPTRELRCFCLELYGVGHFEWGDVAGSQDKWLKTKLDSLEIVDLEPLAMENALECYLATVLKLGILPRLNVPLEKLVLDVTKLLKKQGLQLGKQVTLEPSAVPGDVPNNPAVEDDLLKAFLKLSVTQGGA